MARSLLGEIIHQLIGPTKKKKGKHKSMVLYYNNEPWAYRHTNGYVEKFEDRKKGKYPPKKK